AHSRSMEELPALLAHELHVFACGHDLTLGVVRHAADYRAQTPSGRPLLDPRAPLTQACTSRRTHGGRARTARDRRSGRAVPLRLDLPALAPRRLEHAGRALPAARRPAASAGAPRLRRFSRLD